MPRLHLFELEDQPWLPASVRAYATDCLRLVFSVLLDRTRVAEQLRAMLEATEETHILDLCSGSSGPLVRLIEVLASQGVEVDVLLTDLHPHPELARDLSPRLRYRSEPLDARAVPPELNGLRTCFAGLHHFRPHEAVSILADCAVDGRGLAVFEPAARRLTDFLLVPWIGLVSLSAAPFLRPFRWSRLFWTWIVPMVPIVVMWDGWVSCARCYTVEELRQLAERAVEQAGAGGRYRFDVGRDPVRGLPAGITWVLGRPTEPCTVHVDGPEALAEQAARRDMTSRALR